MKLRYNISVDLNAKTAMSASTISRQRAKNFSGLSTEVIVDDQEPLVDYQTYILRFSRIIYVVC